MKPNVKYELQKIACKVRMDILQSIHTARSGHPGGSLSCVEFLTYLYNKELRINPKCPNDFNRDRFVLSKGHAAPALYSVLANIGFFDRTLLKTLRQLGSPLQGHPNMNSTPGVDVSTGSLGQGVSVACGMALSLKLDNSKFKVFCLAGDGEIQEGQVWEALMFASHNELVNLFLFIDNNGLQLDGDVENVAGLKDISSKLKSFGFYVMNINGNDFEQIDYAINKIKLIKTKPSAVILNTIKGMGISYMENNVKWHGKPPNDVEFNKAKTEICSEMERLRNLIY